MADYQMTLVDRQRIARGTMTFWFDTNGRKYDFRAGQHADFAFMHPPLGGEGDSSRTFSFANSPHDTGLVMIAMRMRKTAFKSALKAAALGTKFTVSRPRGSFTLHKDITRTAVFIAGGISCRRHWHYPGPQHPGVGHTRTDAPQVIFVLFEPRGGGCGVSGGIGSLNQAKSTLHSYSHNHPADVLSLALRSRSHQ